MLPFGGYGVTEIDVVRAGQQAEKDRRKREKTVVTGDMHPLLNALPSLGELMASQSEKTQKSKKTRGTPKEKVVKKETYVHSKHLYFVLTTFMVKCLACLAMNARAWVQILTHAVSG